MYHQAYLMGYLLQYQDTSKQVGYPCQYPILQRRNHYAVDSNHAANKKGKKVSKS